MHINTNCIINLPNNRNLSIIKIVKAINHITNHIFKSIEAIFPTYKPTSKTLIYVNSKIKKMKKQKSKLITVLK